jgi:hypothetical protein
LAYAYAGFKFIDNAYRTMIDFNPYVDYKVEFDILKEYCEILLSGLEAYRVEKN